MNILLIDRALPSSVYSGKTVRLKNIYGRLAQTEKIIYLRTAQPNEETESHELEVWANQSFEVCLRLPALEEPKLINRLSAMLQLKPWYDIYAKHPFEISRIKSYLSEITYNFRIDLVITFDQEIAQYGLLLAKEIPWIQDLGDSMALQLKRQMSNASHSKYLNLLWRLIRESRFEHEMINQSASNIFVAEDDASIHRNGRPNSIQVISNGVDTDYFNSDQVQLSPNQKPFVVFTGHMSFLPNQDAALYFAREIFPLIKKRLPNLEFKIVGADPSESVLKLREIEGVEITGEVSDVRPYLKSASAFVCPMRMGTGIKNKLLEAMAMELPIITTALGLKGIGGIPEGIIEVADDPIQFMELTVKTVNKSLKSVSGKQARQFVQTHYSWNQTLARYHDLFSRIKK